MKLFRYKTRNEQGRIDAWRHVSDSDILEHGYFKSFWFGRMRRKVAKQIFKILIDIQK